MFQTAATNKYRIESLTPGTQYNTWISYGKKCQCQ